MSIETVVVLGAGHAGLNVVTSLRTKRFAGRIVVVDSLSELPYERPPLSKDVLDTTSSGYATPLRKESFYAAKSIELISGISAESVDRINRRVILEGGARVSYDRLVIATGALASNVRVPGATIRGVRTLKTHDDALMIRRQLEKRARVVVVGAGYIGLEVAAAAAKAGCEVTVLEFQDRVMKRVTSQPVSNFFENLHAAHGVDIRLGTALKSIEGESTASAVLATDGQRFSADLVVIGVGITPNQQIAHAAGLICDDGIVVGNDCRTSDPRIFACGDVTRFYERTAGRRIRLECVSNALAQGTRVAHAILDLPLPAHEVPWFWTVQYEERLQTAGVRLPSDTVVIRGDPCTGKFSVLYLRDGVLAALDTVNSLHDFLPGKKLIAAGARIAPLLAQDSTVKLKDAVLEGTRSL